MSWDEVQSEYNCPVCNADIVPISGSGKLMLLGDAPEPTDLVRGLAWQGRNGSILRAELQRLQVDMYDCKLGYLWFHAPNQSEDCLRASVTQILNHLSDVKAVCLIGKDVVEYFTGMKVSQVSATRVNSLYWKKPTWACYTPTMVFQSLGEFRLALSRFVEANR